MTEISKYKAIVIGGSAGSFQSILHILDELPKPFSIPIIITLHRLKQVRSGLVESISIKSRNAILEPFDKQIIERNFIYFAPSNYHILIEPDFSFSLSTEEAVEFSRPSIDVLFTSAAKAYKENLLAILLSGANKDGAQGIKTVKEYGGTVIIQDPKEAEVSIMPKAALDLVTPDYVIGINSIIEILQTIN